MVTARHRNQATFPCQERPWDGAATISVSRPRPKTGAAEFDREWDKLGLPRVLETQLKGKGVAMPLSAMGQLATLPFCHRFPDFFGVPKGRKGLTRNFRIYHSMQ